MFFDALVGIFQSLGLWEQRGFHLGRLSVVALIVIVTAISFENVTGWVYLKTVDKKVDALNKLNELSEEGIEQNSELAPIYYELVEDVERHNTHSFFISFGQLKKSLNQPYDESNSLQFLSGAWLWIVISIVGLLYLKQKWAYIIMSIFFGIPAGLISIYMPTILHPIVDFIVHPVAWVIFIIILGKVLPTNKSNKSEAINTED